MEIKVFLKNELRLFHGLRVTDSGVIYLPRMNTDKHRFLETIFGIILYPLKNLSSLPKEAVNPKWQENQKNSCSIEQMAPPSLKRSGFVFINVNSKTFKGIEHKTKCRCFFDERGTVKSHIAGLTKRFGYFGAPKYHALAA